MSNQRFFFTKHIFYNFKNFLKNLIYLIWKLEKKRKKIVHLVIQPTMKVSSHFIFNTIQKKNLPRNIRIL